MKYFLCALAAIVVISSTAANGADPTDDQLKCKIDAVTQCWLTVADISKEIVGKLGSNDSEVKDILEKFYKGTKGSHDLFKALPPVAQLSSEARFQLEQNFIGSPVSIKAEVSTIQTSFPDVYQKFEDEFKKIDSLASQFTADVAVCAKLGTTS